MQAIAWSLAAAVLSALLALFVQRRLAPFPLVMGIVVVLFGGYSLVTHEATAYMMQHTLYYGIGGVLLVYGLLRGKSFLKPMFDNLFALTDHGWMILTRRWACLFFLLAGGNEWVWRTMPEAVWAHYKLGMTVSITLFGLWQLRLARRERLPNASRWGLKIRDDDGFTMSSRASSR